MTVHPNSIASYESIRLSDREAAVLSLYVPGESYTDDDLAGMEGKANSRETSPRITGLRDKGLVIEEKHGATKNGRPVRTTRLPEKAAEVKAEQPRKPYCFCRDAGFIKSSHSKFLGKPALFCANPIHGPNGKFYSAIPAVAQ